MSAIEQYLQQLKKTVPAHLRDDIQAETRSHLEALTLDLQKEGTPRPQAEILAVKKFGSPRKLGGAWKRASGVVDWFDIMLAALPILGITGLGWTFVGQHISLGVYLAMFGIGAFTAWRRNWPTWWYAWLGWLMLALLVVEGTAWVFFIVFPVLVTLLAIDRWQQATLMTLPFTTYLAFATLIERQHLTTTGWGPGSIYPGNIIWLETVFSIIWILILAAGLRAARPSRRGFYMLAGLLGTQLMYVLGIVLMIVTARLLPSYFITTLTTGTILFVKLPVALFIIGLTLYPPLVWLIASWLRNRLPQPGLSA